LGKTSVVLTAISLLALAAVGCAEDSANQYEKAGTTATDGGSPTAEAVKPIEIVIDNFTFSPAELTIAAGTKVTWVNHDDVPHTATSTAKPRSFASGTLDTDEKFSHVFTTPGTYEYFCAVHPKMTGRIIVK
jgi:plastocyanin